MKVIFTDVAGTPFYTCHYNEMENTPLKDVLSLAWKMLNIERVDFYKKLRMASESDDIVTKDPPTSIYDMNTDELNRIHHDVDY